MSDGIDAPPLFDNLSKEDKNWGMACHLSALIGLLPLVPGIGFVIGPLMVWLIKRDEMPFVADQGKESLNFQLTVLSALGIIFILFATSFAIAFIPIIGAIIFVLSNIVCGLLVAAISIGALCSAIFAGIKASEGKVYRYPYIYRFIK